MDEYDVFLDEAARKITLGSIGNYSREHEFRGVQFLIITPHNLKSLKTSSILKIQEMPVFRNTAVGLQQQTL